MPLSEKDFNPDVAELSEAQEINRRGVRAVEVLQDIVKDLAITPSFNESDLGIFLKNNLDKDINPRAVFKSWEAEIREGEVEFIVSLDFNLDNNDVASKVVFCLAVGAIDESPDMQFLVSFDALNEQWRVRYGSDTMRNQTKEQAAQFIYEKNHSLPELESAIFEFNINVTEPTFVSEDQAIEIIRRVCKSFEKKFIENTN